MHNGALGNIGLCVGVADLLLASLIPIVLTIALVAALARLRVRERRRPRAALLVAAAMLLALFVLFVRGDARLARLVPWSAAIVATDVTLPLAAAIAVLLWPILPKPKWRKSLVAAAIVLAGGVASFDALRLAMLGPPPTRDLWRGNVAMQATRVTCGPAAAATLLRTAGIEAGETGLAVDCLTHSSGSPTLGIWRGLSLATRGSDVRPIVVTGDPLAAGRPVLVAVGLPRWSAGDVDPRYERDWGWEPGQQHVVVIFGVNDDGSLDVGDPAVGRERWSRAALDELYRGAAFALVPRE